MTVQVRIPLAQLLEDLVHSVVGGPAPAEQDHPSRTDDRPPAIVALYVGQLLLEREASG